MTAIATRILAANTPIALHVRLGGHLDGLGPAGGSAGVAGAGSGSVPAGCSISTAPTNRYPTRGSVSTYLGTVGESPNTSRSRFTAEFTLWSNSTIVPPGHSFVRISS